MKNKFVLSLVLCAWSLCAFSNVVTGVAAIPDGYYDGVDGKSSANSILDALWNIIKDHNVIAYKSLEPYYEQTDFYGDTVWDMYSTCRFTMDDANKPQSEVCDAWNKEHSIPQSWFNEGSPMKSDLFHVYPTDARVNNFRSNYPYGEVSGGNGTGFKDNKDGHGLGKLGTNTFPGYSGKVFEPADDYKGDFARTYFYMVARYRDRDLTNSEGSNVFTSSKTNLTDFAKNLFLKWHRNDPVSDKEIDRNQAVYGIQHNRNPFIDYPDLAEYIWGNKVGQTVDISSMTPTCDGGSATTTVKYGVTWFVNGTALQVDSIKENNKIAILPVAPSSCSATSETFVGWTSAAISGISATAPAVLYKAANEFPAVTADVAYYAVFAHARTTESESVASTEKFVFSELCSDQAVVTTLSAGDVTLTFDKGSNNNAPKYFNNGGALRCYGGNTIKVEAQTITQIDITFGTSDGSNAITANCGSFDGTHWTGEDDAVIFTIGGTSGNRRLAKMEVTVNGSGAQTVYSDFLTNCTTTDMEQIHHPSYSRKVMIDGMLFIMVDNQLYNLQGQRIK